MLLCPRCAARVLGLSKVPEIFVLLLRHRRDRVPYSTACVGWGDGTRWKPSPPMLLILAVVCVRARARVRALFSLLGFFRVALIGVLPRTSGSNHDTDAATVGVCVSCVYACVSFAVAVLSGCSSATTGVTDFGIRP